MEYEIKYSKRRTIALSVKDDKLIVRAPFFTPKTKIDEIVYSHRNWIAKSLEKQRIKNARFEGLTDEQIKELKRCARIILTQKTEHYANIMGLKYGRITITSAKTSFGSCSEKGNISYSYRLMLYPEDAIDYVVVHELSHLVFMNHSAEFYKLVETVLPDYKRRRKMLKI